MSEISFLWSALFLVRDFFLTIENKGHPFIITYFRTCMKFLVWNTYDLCIKSILYSKLPVIRNALYTKSAHYNDIFDTITVLLYFWANKCSFGEHKRKKIFNTFWTEVCVYQSTRRKLIPISATAEGHCYVVIGIKSTIRWPKKYIWLHRKVSHLFALTFWISDTF